MSTVVTQGASYANGYDAQTGKVTSVSKTDAHGLHMQTFGFDGVLPTAQSWGGDAGLVHGTVSRVYDPHFRVDRLRVNGADIVDYGYDRDDLLTSAGPMSIARRADNGLLTGTTLGSVTTSQSVTSFGELDVQSASYAGTLYYEEDVLSRDERGRIESRTESVMTDTRSYEYSYDGAGRLTDVLADGVPASSYDYDANGNRTAHVTSAGTVIGRYDAQDRLQRYCPEDAAGEALPTPGLPCFVYSYLPSGELLTKADLVGGESWTYDYDEFEALQRVETFGGSTVEYEIDASGRRVGKWVDGVKQWGLLYGDGLRPIAQLDASDNVVSVFVYATRAHVPDFMVRDGVTYRLVTDHRGSMRLAVNASTGAVSQRMEYDEFGNVLADTNPGFQPFGFAGGLYDADTGLVRFGARDYDAVTGRWTAKDPILFDGGQANLYVYVGNDPVNRIDPTGTYSLDDFAEDWGNGAKIITDFFLCKFGVWGQTCGQGKCELKVEECRRRESLCETESERAATRAACDLIQAQCMGPGGPGLPLPPIPRRGVSRGIEGQ